MSDERSLEDDADHSAVGVVLRLWGHARALAGRTMPALRSGLRLQSCGMSGKEKEQAAKDLLAIITDPMGNEAEIIKKMEALGGDGPEVLMLTPPFNNKSDDSRIRMFAGTEAGQRVLAKGTSILHDGDVVAKVRADAIDKILAEYTPTTPPTIKPDEQTALDRINKAIDADARKPEYSKSTPPLRLPVTRLNFGTEMFGGVYYNPHMSGNDAGRTRLRSLKNPESGNVAYMLVYIELGPNALTNTDEYLRSVMWHEFIHYQQYMRFRGPEASKTAATKILETESASTSQEKPNAEIEATSIQLVTYFDTFNDAEVQDVLWYLAQHMGHMLLNADFKKAAIDRIVAALAGDRAKQDRMLNIIGKMKKAEKTALDDLVKAIKANLAPKSKGKGKK